MAHKTFISYKYSESCDLRDAIIESLGDDAKYYRGETSDSPDLTDLKTDTIKEKLKDMLFETSVTIVIISPNMKDSNWIDWEIEYSLKQYKRGHRTSHTNGIVAVIQKDDESYSWFKSEYRKPDGHFVVSFKNDLTFDIIRNNRGNQVPKQYCCNECKSINPLTGSYISYVEEEEFLKDPNRYIDNAFDKSQNNAEGYKLSRCR